MILNIKDINYNNKMLIAVYADGNFLFRELFESDADMGKEKSPSLKIDLPKCKTVKLICSKKKESLITGPRYLEYFISTIFTLINIFMPKLFTDQYFMNYFISKKTEITLSGNFYGDKELDLRFSQFTYLNPYLNLETENEDIKITYDYDKREDEIEDSWNEYRKMLLKYLLITIVLGAILIIDTFGPSRIGYVGFFGMLIIPLGVIQYFKLYIIGIRQKNEYKEIILNAERGEK
ncbi:MAG: hypothetical protein JJE03_05250 [Peptostreptococcaceae bacterium]|nr:hypothetical protein [Peptostreptococcaceae bacterium]